SPASPAGPSFNPGPIYSPVYGPGSILGGAALVIIRITVLAISAIRIIISLIVIVIAIAAVANIVYYLFALPRTNRLRNCLVIPEAARPRAATKKNLIIGTYAIVILTNLINKARYAIKKTKIILSGCAVYIVKLERLLERRLGWV
ncbi:hypothetical protein NEUTE2DRAFT_74068, partial [Neurospora tetrasperma FGSC 2509]